jgi:hypothetical protein
MRVDVLGWCIHIDEVTERGFRYKTSGDSFSGCALGASRIAEIAFESLPPEAASLQSLGGSVGCDVIVREALQQFKGLGKVLGHHLLTCVIYR